MTNALDTLLLEKGGLTADDLQQARAVMVQKNIATFQVETPRNIKRFDYWANLSYPFFIQTDDRTLNERKSRMHQIRGIKGEAVVIYCEPLITQEMRCHRLSRRVKNMTKNWSFTYATVGEADYRI